MFHLCGDDTITGEEGLENLGILDKTSILLDLKIKGDLGTKIVTLYQELLIQFI
jgi:hypothetical protein